MLFDIKVAPFLNICVFFLIRGNEVLGFDLQLSSGKNHSHSYYRNKNRENYDSFM